MLQNILQYLDKTQLQSVYLMSEEAKKTNWLSRLAVWEILVWILTYFHSIVTTSKIPLKPISTGYSQCLGDVKWWSIILKLCSIMFWYSKKWGPITSFYVRAHPAKIGRDSCSVLFTYAIILSSISWSQTCSHLECEHLHSLANDLLENLWVMS